MRIKKMLIIMIISIMSMGYHTFMLFSAAGGEEVYPDPRRFESTILGYEANDRIFMPPEGEILGVGSSSMVGWHNMLYWDLEPLTITPRGFGGSTINDALYYADRIITKYKPRAILLYEGDNDIGLGVDVDTYMAKFNEFITKIKQDLPGTRVYFIAIKPSIARWHLWPLMNEANTRVQQICAGDDLLTYLDTATPMLGKDGTPRPELFLSDNLHMNRTGYELWRDVIRPILLEKELNIPIEAQTTPAATPIPTLTNIAVGKPAYVSSEYSSSYPLSALNDGDENTIWGSSTDTTAQWFYIDLGEVTATDGIGLNWYGSFYSTSYNIYTSLDGESWDFVVSGSGHTGGFEQLEGRLTGRYIGILSLGQASSALGLTEFEIYTARTDIVTFDDKNLEQVIRNATGKSFSTIYKTDLEGVKELNAANKRITSLAGIEHCTGLEKLDLHTNSITDFTPLSGITSLKVLNISNNGATTIAPLATMTGLIDINAGNNSIITVTALSSLTNLQKLNLADNTINNIDALNGLTQLTDLNVANNPLLGFDCISNMSQLTTLNLKNTTTTPTTPGFDSIKNCPALSVLNLQSNAINDLTLLGVNNAMKVLYLDYNTISDISVLNGYLNLEWCFILYNDMPITAGDPQGDSNLAVISALQARSTQVSYSAQQ